MASTGGGNPPAPFNVLYTDYNNLAVAHVCTHIYGIGTIEHFWVYTRAKLQQASASWNKQKTKAMAEVRERSLESYADLTGASSFLEAVYQGN